jgi:hypothetical protein
MRCRTFTILSKIAFHAPGHGPEKTAIWPQWPGAGYVAVVRELERMDAAEVVGHAVEFDFWRWALSLVYSVLSAFSCCRSSRMEDLNVFSESSASVKSCLPNFCSSASRKGEVSNAWKKTVVQRLEIAGRLFVEVLVFLFIKGIGGIGGMAYVAQVVHRPELFA